MDLSTRLYGSLNRIAWSSADMQRLARHFGGAAPPAKAANVSHSFAVLKGEPDGSSYRWVISTSSVDRMGDTVAVNGWDLTQFRKNPVVLFAHNSGVLPIGKATSVSVMNNKLVAKMQFALTADAGGVRELVDQGFLRAASVGFRPLKWSFAKSTDRPAGIDFHEQELLEFSIVPVPANGDCLIMHDAQARRMRQLDLMRLRGL